MSTNSESTPLASTGRPQKRLRTILLDLFVTVSFYIGVVFGALLLMLWLVYTIFMKFSQSTSLVFSLLVPVLIALMVVGIVSWIVYSYLVPAFQRTRLYISAYEVTTDISDWIFGSQQLTSNTASVSRKILLGVCFLPFIFLILGEASGKIPFGILYLSLSLLPLFAWCSAGALVVLIFWMILYRTMKKGPINRMYLVLAIGLISWFCCFVGLWFIADCNNHGGTMQPTGYRTASCLDVNGNDIPF